MGNAETKNPAAPAHQGRQHPWAIFLIFLRLKLTSFGDPVAHPGFFRQEFVERRKWLRSIRDVYFQAMRMVKKLSIPLAASE